MVIFRAGGQFLPRPLSPARADGLQITKDGDWREEAAMGWGSDTALKREFERFAAEASDALFRTGYLMTGDVRDTEDLVQETFLRVAQRWGRVRSMDYPAAYARRILINLVLRGARRRSQQKAELGPQAAAIETADENAARALRDVDDLAEFRWALAQLPARQRAVLVLRYWADLPVTEVAGILGCSASTVTSTASRAAARLANVLTCGEPSPSDSPARNS
jgi:RNA polymerase sigma-70 factor (sigma-E family)